MAALDQFLAANNERIRNRVFDGEDLNKAIYSGAQLGARIRSNEEAARQQSARNLIAQRMGEGYDWTQLGAEAAQFDPELASRMDNQFMRESQWNREENAAYLAEFRDEMTRRKFSEVLEQWRNNPEMTTREGFMSMCEQAAANVAKYNAQLAKELLQWIKTEIDAGAIDRQKRDLAKAKSDVIKDHEKEFNKEISKAGDSTDSEQDPRSYARRLERADAARMLMRWKQRDPYDQSRNPEGRTVWLRMIDFLTSNPNWRSLDENQLSSMFGNGLTFEDHSPAIDDKKDDKNANVNPVGTHSKSSDNESVPKNFMRKGLGNQWIYDSTKGEQMSNAIQSASTMDDIKKLRAAMSASGEIKKSNVGIFDDFQKQIDAKEKQIIGNEEKYGKDATPAFKKAIDKMLGSSRTVTSLNAQMTAFHNVVQTADKTKSPKTILNSILLAQLPFYKPTDYDAKSSLDIKNASNSWEDMRSVIRKMGIPFFSSLAEYDNIDAALDAALQDFTRTFNGMYDTMVAGADENEAKEIRTQAEARWNLNAKDWTILKNGRLKIGTLRKESVKKADEDYGRYYTNDEGVNVDSKTGKPIENSNGSSINTSEIKANYSPESWDDF